MRVSKELATMTVVILVLAAATTMAGVPQLMNYQGRLTNDQGEPLDTTVSMTFTIYDDSTGGNPIWTETQTAVTVTDGLFNVLLGSTVPMHDTLFQFCEDPKRYLGIAIAGDPEMTRRTRFVTVPYAFGVFTVDGATGGEIDGNLSIGIVHIEPDSQIPYCLFRYNGQSSCDPKLQCVNPKQVNVGDWKVAPYDCGLVTVTDGNDVTITLEGGSGDVSACGKGLFGEGHDNPGDFAFVAGCNNTVSGDFSTVSGGWFNVASGIHSTVGGGKHNQAGGFSPTIAGGDSNSVPAGSYHCTIGGGEDNIADAYYCTVGGGGQNNASGFNNTIGGGTQNWAWDVSATISGGSNNQASAASAIGGGVNNTASGSNSAIPGGQENMITASGSYSMAFGYDVHIDNAYRVAFFDCANSGMVGINRDDQDVDADGTGILFPLHIGCIGANNGNGAHCTPGGAWATISTKAVKENSQSLDSKTVLETISEMTIEAWEYKNTKERHIWPYAEDFVKAFDVGTERKDGTREDRYLSTGDIAGVALVAIQELHKKNTALETEVAELKALVQKLLTERQ